jgi:putative membrane protein
MNRRCLILAVCLVGLMAGGGSVMAQPEPGPTQAGSKSVELPDTFWVGVWGSLIYGPIGIIMAVLGFKVFDWVTPRIDIQKELAEKHNMAVAVVCVAIILGVCYLVTHIVH